MTTLALPMVFSGYWLHAHGEGGGEDFDLVMERDEDNLPMLGGRHVTGLLRVALRRAEAWNWFDKKSRGVDALLLGQRSGAGSQDGTDTAPGCLAVGNATVSEGLRAAVEKEPSLRSEFFSRVASTAIDARRGVAKPKQLRAIEAAMPLRLYSYLDFDDAARRLWCGRDTIELARLEEAKKLWRGWVATAWPAFDEAGAKRTRGFGRLAYTALDDGRHGPAGRAA
ncbi:MAG TPA: hypothetical protein VFC47_05090 [Caulobacteraceae bacterium]|nr:hypothetical protein [Caulobacteraceae bacterium]